MRLPLVTAVTLGLLSGSAQAVNVYSDNGTDLSIFGRFEGGFYNRAANETRDHNQKSGASVEGEARIGVSASTTLVTNIKGIAFGEWEVASESSENGHFNTRYAYTGFDLCQYGSLVFGQGDTAKYITVGMTDVFEHYGNTSNSYWELGGRQEGQIMYVNAVGGYTLGFSYQTPRSGMAEHLNHDTRVKQDLDVNAGYAVALAYNWQDGPAESLAFSLAYDWYDFHQSPAGDRHSFSSGISYGHLNDGLYTAFVYSRDKYQREDHHMSGYEGVLGYTMENGLGFTAGYGYYGYENNRREVSEITGQVAYHFTPAFMAYAEGRFGLGRVDYPAEETHQHAAYMINLQYNF